MITVLFPPGCYGNYLARCLFNYTNLNPNPPQAFEFDSAGSSHIVREQRLITSNFAIGHLGLGMDLSDSAKIVKILPVTSNWIDYYDNQYAKNNSTNILTHIYTQFDPKELDQKLQQGWGYTGILSNSTPMWMLREFFSFWLMDCLKSGWDEEQYRLVPSAAVCNTNDIFYRFSKTIQYVSAKLGLELTADPKLIESNHQAFLQKQQYHGQQLRCESWVADICQGLDSDNPCKTVFDEAYVQYLLRTQEHEIRCDGLDIFPDTSAEMRKLLYNTGQ